MLKIYGVKINQTFFFVIVYFLKKFRDIFSLGNKMEMLGNKKSSPRFLCNICDYTTCKKSSFENHILSSKHNLGVNLAGMEIIGNAKSSPKLCSFLYRCDICDYSTSKKSNFDAHKLTRKHNDGWKTSQNKPKTSPNYATPKSCAYLCSTCNKSYLTSSGLWKHSQKCGKHINELAKQITDKDELILFLIKENTEFKNMIIEQQNNHNNVIMRVLENNNVANYNNINANNNCMNNNKIFNLQFFLNETCKDAMNIMDFVDSIKLQLTDLEKFGDLDYVDGISSIITTNLQALDITQRPIHCTDKKRETMYIKDENKWEREDDNRTKIKRAIKRIANKNIDLLPKFREKYPEYKNASSRISDKYDKMVIEAMGGVGNNDLEKENKIIHNISKCTTIDKCVKNSQLG